ncbi:MAG: tRNA (guanosine(37)-N1)-methyltransferase TrmD [Caldisericum sp.]|jgi:tRNA (guanine37-N1)-methyltransferase|nr:tRNA (guanosine(37)-N1)-methyltransferase TrmD [Caldisericum sp.]
MEAHFLTIFPEFFECARSFGLFRVGIERNILYYYVHNLRDFTKDKHKTTDDTPYGGGAGMVMLVEPIVKGVEYIEENYGKQFKILTSPQGIKLDQTLAKELSSKEKILFIPTHYEGVDERVMNFVDMEVSIGDYVLSGGEIASLVILDAALRLVEGLLHNKESLSEETFESNLLEYPQYTRPFDFRGESVPEVLRSGNHKEIERFRKKESLKRTLLKRPDLLLKHEFTKEEKELLKEIGLEIEELIRRIT